MSVTSMRGQCFQPQVEKRPHGSFCSGFTLVEVLVAIILLAIGLLGLAALQGVSLKNNHTAYYRSIASQQAYDIEDRMRANIVGVNLGGYDNLTSTLPSDPGCFSSNCTAANMAVTDQYQWLTVTGAMLAGGTGSVRCVEGPSANCVTNSPNSNRIFDVTVTWTERLEGGYSLTQGFVTRFSP